MIRTTLCALALIAATLTLCCSTRAQSPAATDAEKPAYLNPDLPAEQRAADLVHRMTLEEKATQLVNQARAIPHLNIPAYDWWSESLHGVAAKGMTSFPEPIGLAATFDAPAIHEMAIAIGTEGRIHHVQSVRAGHSDIFEGLDFWAPNINIFRDPRWGRGQETYGEDPFLTSRMGTAFVTGMQGDDPRYYRVISTPKHFAVHSGPESTRHKANVDVSKHDELDTYLPAFRYAITQGKAGSIMCAYNSINGEPACASTFLLEDQLRDKWKFKGYVVSDCGAVIDIFNGHKFKPTQAEASAISLQRGMDNECADFFEKVSDDHDYKPYLDAVKSGALKESEIDTAVTRLYTARIKLGMFDPPDMVPYNRIDEKLLDSATHRALARKMANESMVLLKNTGILPIKVPGPGLKIAVVGPLANQTKVLMGNYSSAPSHAVSVLDGLKTEFPTAKINFVEGTQFLSKNAAPVPSELLTTDGKSGVRSSYVVMSPMAIFSGGAGPAPEVLASRIDPAVGTPSGPPPAEIAGKKSVLISSEATLTPKETADYFSVPAATPSASSPSTRKVVALSFLTAGVETKLGRVHLEAGKSYAVKVLYPVPGGDPTNPTATPPQLVWTKFDPRPSPEAIADAKSADVIIAVVGITSELEGEEMPINEEGFSGGDRTSLDLPKPEEDLVEAVAAAGKPLIVVLMNGSALSVNWAKDHANAILESWYAGEEGGAAIAETISGKNNPGGRLPVTFYTGVSQLPPFEDYAMKNRTYRYFDGTPLYPFGYGLSYTTFSFNDLKLSTSALNAGDPLNVEATVTNNGKIPGDEIAELYLSFPKVPGAPNIALRGFHRVHLSPGASQKVQFTLDPRDLSIVTESGTPTVAEGDYVLYIGGGQPHATPAANLATAAGTGQTFRIKGTITLPE